MKEILCPKCDTAFDSQWKLNKHLERAFPCDEGDYECEKCNKRYQHQSNLSTHKKKCQGRKMSSQEKDKKIADLETVLAATGNQRGAVSSQPIHQTSSVNNTINGNGTIINGDQINNIQNTVVVLPLGCENIDHLRKMSITELQSLIGLKSEPSTMIKLFELIRTDENHPENHTMLLPDVNGQVIHYKSENGWVTDSFNNSMQRAIHADNSFLIRKLPDNFADKVFQDGYIMNEIQQKINFCQHDALKCIYDGVRSRLHELTKKLAEQHDARNKLSTDNSTQKTESITMVEQFADADADDDEDGELLKIEKELLQIRKKELLRNREKKKQIRL